MNARLLLSFRPLVMATILSAAGAFPCRADRPTPTPTQPPARRGNSLTDIAKSKQLKGGEKGKPIVITNENLSNYASQRELTTANKSKAPPGRPVRAGAGTVVTPSNSGHVAERKRFWQAKYTQQLKLIASLKQQIEGLDYQIPGLWRDFYAWDDPAYRDGVIKPKIDRAISQRDALEAKLELEESRLHEIKDAARQDGAEPGWFREIKEPTAPPPSPTPEMIVY